MNTFDWLGDMELPGQRKFNIVEIRFKGGRKEFYRNENSIDLYPGEHVVVEVQNGWNVGQVSLQGELVRLQMMKRGVSESEEIPTILRKPSPKDYEKFEQAKESEANTMYRSRQLAQELGLEMKISDVECQADGNKTTFYYSADGRVDFRELIKRLASEFRVRVEMRQISLREEAGRIGGIGVCGRELCCSTWLTDFKTVTTAAARYQNLSLNPIKLSGQCGRLKCCLNYELDTYVDALKNIPTIERPLETEIGTAKLQKVDIFKQTLWFSFNNESSWHAVSADRAFEILELNRKGIKPVSLVEKDFLNKEENPKLDFSSRQPLEKPKDKDSRSKKGRERKRWKSKKSETSKEKEGKKKETVIQAKRKKSRHPKESNRQNQTKKQNGSTQKPKLTKRNKKND
jgi:cell fate regulator YaaT (PSP1 superfamily)